MTAAPPPLRLMIAEDQPLIRQALATMLAAESGVTVVAEAADGEEALQKARAFHPDVILMDLRMPRLDGIAATRRVLAEFPADDDASVFEAISAGAQGYLLKDAQVPDIVAAVKAVARGEPGLAPGIARKIMDEFRRLRPAGAVSAPELVSVERLSVRENDILALIVEGRSNAEIAAALALADGTVKNYVSRILDKLHAKNRTELATRAMRDRLG